MKLKLLITLLFCGINSYASGVRVFIPTEKGYEQVEIKLEVMSANNILNFLGYNKEEFYTYSNYTSSNHIFSIEFKSFTSEIICISTDDTIDSITQKDIDNYLVNYSFKDVFGAYEIEYTLKNGVKHKTLSQEFLSEIFNKSLSDSNSFIALEIGYELHFENGFLSSYNSSDGLNKWAKSWKNEIPERYRKYYNEASRYQTNETDILKELNAQADAFASIPNGVYNEYIKFHTNDSGIVNYKMLFVAHYNKTMNLDEFKLINKGRYELSNEFNDQNNYKRTTYRVNKGLYTFDEKGQLINSYTSN
ncbi:hypothetical protein [Pontimicrobium sp. IMCC45349]|uniref:hypothetical protein n=1 Tax=Pontimicrobium sp. IMCC45349 TaxID=3391574 RepID=UPI0039A105FD